MKNNLFRVDTIVSSRKYYTYVLKKFDYVIMHGSILPVTIPPPGQPRGQVQPFGPGGGELFEAVLSRGEGAGQIENNFLLFL